MIDSSLWDAYRNTRFWVHAEPDPFCFRVGERSAELARLLACSGHTSAVFVTACNPGSEQLSDEANRVRHAELLHTLRTSGKTFLDGAGRDPSHQWPEEQSVLVFGFTRAEAVAIGGSFDQNAVVWIGPDAVPELLDTTGRRLPAR